MFTIEKAPSRSPTGERRCVMDRDRDVWLQKTDGVAMSPCDCFRLVWGGRVIPFAACWKPATDAAGDNLLHWNMGQFGHAQTVQCGPLPPGAEDDLEALSKAAVPIPPYTFADAAEREQAARLAAEALIHYGRYYEGIKHRKRPVIVTFEGRTFTRDDF